jgi:hypothetical protein
MMTDACNALVLVYEENLDKSGPFEPSDVDYAHSLARKALGMEP